MLRVLASFLLLGVFPHVNALETPQKLSGIELVSINSPAVLPAVDPPALTASGAILMDLTSGQQIFSKNADTARPMASLTKIMTALIILEEHNLDEMVTVSDVAESVGGSAMGLSTKQHIRLGDLLSGMLIGSANDAAYALAAYHSGTVSAFVDEMNARAQSLGLNSTHFSNPAGLDQQGQKASPRDLMWLTIAALQHEEFRNTVRTKSLVVYSREGTEFHLHNTNEFLHSHDNVFGVKTGTTDGAGQCLITLFTAGDRSYLFAVLGSNDRYRDAQSIMQTVVAMLPGGNVVVQQNQPDDVQ